MRDPLARVPDWAFRVGGAIGFGVYACWRASRYDRNSGALFFLETAVFFLIMLAYVTRRAPKERASGLAETAVPLVGAVLPFGILIPPEHDLSPGLATFAISLLIGGTALAVLGYVFLRRSFAIFVEARLPVLGGPYRVIRHPVYAGQIVACAGGLIWHFAALSAAVYVAFVTIQVARAHMEEQKLARAFPEYAAHRARTWRFVPFVY